MSSLREAMMRADAQGINDDDAAGPRAAYLAVGRELAALEEPEPDPAIAREAERQAREDEYASWAMEIIVRARQRIGRTKWSSAEGQAKRRIVEALRCLAPDE